MFILFHSCKTKTKKHEEKDKITINNNVHLSFNYSPLKGLETEEGITRRDPSDVILENGTYYLWYTKTDKGFSGYNASIWYATSLDGIHWQEKGEALPKGYKGNWDAFSVFTPNIFKANGKFYLVYTGVKPTPENKDGLFENNSSTDITALGLAVANYPNGPFKRVGDQPILEISVEQDNFDSYRIDDACVVYRENLFWLYYKGRSAKYGADGPKHTKMGVAVSDHPEGPYVKYVNNPITNGGHEVMVWPYEEGVMTLLSSHGNEGKTIQYAKNGIDFSIVGYVGDDYPKAPSYFRFDDFKDISNQSKEISWGISMHYGSKSDNIWPHLLRFEIDIKKDK